MRIKLEQVTKNYGNVQGISNINLDVGTGITGILGPNGAGKSTTMKMILGLSLMNQGNSMISLMYPLSAFFQELLFIKNNSGTISTNNSYIPLPPSVIRQLPQIANRFNKEEIEYALAILGEIDKRLKTTSMSDEALFTHFLFSVLQANG